MHLPRALIIVNGQKLPTFASILLATHDSSPDKLQFQLFPHHEFVLQTNTTAITEGSTDDLLVPVCRVAGISEPIVVEIFQNFELFFTLLSGYIMAMSLSLFLFLWSVENSMKILCELKMLHFILFFISFKCSLCFRWS